MDLAHHKLSGEPSPRFAHPKHERRTYNDNNPIGKFQTFDIEETMYARQFDQCYLCEEDECTDEQHTVAAFKM